MSKIATKVRNMFIRDMKECFRLINLRVEEGKKEGSHDFMSTLDTQSLWLNIYLKSLENCESIGINISFGAMRSGKIAEVFKLMNLINGIMPDCYYSMCPYCNELTVHAQISLSENKLPMAKFSRLLQYLLETTHFTYPLFGRVAFPGDKPEECYGRYKDYLRNIAYQGGGPNEEMEKLVLNNLMSSFTDLNITVTDDMKIKGRFYLQSVHPEDQELSFLTGIELNREDMTVVISSAPNFTIPDENMEDMREMANRINRLCEIEHCFIDDEDKENVFLLGLRYGSEAIQKEEFQNAFNLIIKDALCWFPVFKELLTSKESPTKLIRKRIPCYNDQTTMH